MAGKSIAIQNKDLLREALRGEEDPEVKRKLSFISLVAAGMEVEEAASHFGICVATGYNWIRHWNSEGIERLRPRKSPGRTPRLSWEKLKELKSMLEAKPYWNLKEVRRLIKEFFGVDCSDDQVRRIVVDVLPVNHYLTLCKHFSKAYFLDVAEYIRKTRMIKSDYEVAQIKKACNIVTRVMEEAQRIIRPGMTELEVDGLLGSLSRRMGHQGLVHMRGYNQKKNFMENWARLGKLWSSLYDPEVKLGP